MVVEEKYLKAVENLVKIERDESLSEFEQEVDSFFNYLLSLFKTDLERDFKSCLTSQSSTILELSAYTGPYDSIVLRRGDNELYIAGPGRKNFCDAAKKVTDILNSIGKIKNYHLTFKNYTTDELAEFTFELYK